MVEAFFEKQTIVLGCGNPLFGDDGFGPAVIERLEAEGGFPETVALLDMGTGLKDFIFDLILAPVKPARVFLIDAACLPNQKPGEIFEMTVSATAGVAAGKRGKGFSHQGPSLAELQEWGRLPGVELRLLAVQAGKIPEAVEPGLSPEVQKAVEKICAWLKKELWSR